MYNKTKCFNEKLMIKRSSEQPLTSKFHERKFSFAKISLHTFCQKQELKNRNNNNNNNSKNGSSLLVSSLYIVRVKFDKSVIIIAFSRKFRIRACMVGARVKISYIISYIYNWHGLPPVYIICYIIAVVCEALRLLHYKRKMCIVEYFSK